MMNEKRKFNFFDFFLIVLIIIAVVGATWFLGRNNGGDGDTTRISYVVEVQKLTEDEYGTIEIGDKVLDSVGKYDIGVITAIDTVPYTVNMYNSVSGVMEQVVMEGYSSLRLTIEADATVTDYEITVGSYRIAVGKGINIQSRHFVGTGFCLTIDVTED